MVGDAPARDAAVRTRPRNRVLEEVLLRQALDIARLQDDNGIVAFADERSGTGGIRVGIDWDHEGEQEAADWINYLLFGLTADYARWQMGDRDATERCERRLRKLALVLLACAQ